MVQFTKGDWKRRISTETSLPGEGSWGSALSNFSCFLKTRKSPSNYAAADKRISDSEKRQEFLASFPDFEADGAGARPSYDRLQAGERRVEDSELPFHSERVGASPKEGLRDWSRPGIVYHEALPSDDSDSSFAIRMLVVLKVYIILVSVLLIGFIIYYVYNYAR